MRICPECERTTTALTCPADGTPTVSAALFTAGPDPLPGTILADRYRIIGLLGRGGMGKVYSAEQVAVKRVVAVKVIRPDPAIEPSARMAMVKRFQREAMAVSRLAHPNTVRVFDHGCTDDGLLYIVLEFLRGRPLGRVFKAEGALSCTRAARMGLQVCKSLAEAHGMGIVHRDLKPDNVFLSEVIGERELVKVLDFGIAKVVSLDTGDSGITATGVIVGTPAYMAPEQATGRPVTPSSDLYSLGVILFQAVTGRQPFTGETPVSILMKHASQPVPPMFQDGVPPGVPATMVQLIHDLLEKDPSMRPRSALEVARRLERILADLPDDEALQACDDGDWTPEPGTVEVPEVVAGDAPTSAVCGPGIHGADTSLLAAEGTDGTPIERHVRGSSLLDHWRWAAGSALAVALASGVFLAIVLGGETGTEGTGGIDAGNDGLPAELAASPDSPPAVAPTTASGSDAMERDAGQEVLPLLPAPVVEEKMRPEAGPARPRLPECEALRCPFRQDCRNASGRRVRGEAFCFPRF